MLREAVIEKVNELEGTLRQALSISQEFYGELLDDYAVQVWALKSIGDSYPWEKAIDIQERHSKIESRMPNITKEEFEEYVLLNDLLGVLYKEIKNV